MTEAELAKQLKASNYTCEGVSCEECRKTNYLHVCLMADVRLYCDEILGKDNYINRLKKENAELKEIVSRSGFRIAELKHECDELVARLNGIISGDVAWQGDMDATIKQNIELKRRIDELTNSLTELKRDNFELKEHCKAVDELNTKMECCGNCKKIFICRKADVSGMGSFPYNCKDWELAE